MKKKKMQPLALALVAAMLQNSVAAVAQGFTKMENTSLLELQQMNEGFKPSMPVQPKTDFEANDFEILDNSKKLPPPQQPSKPSQPPSQPSQPPSRPSQPSQPQQPQRPPSQPQQPQQPQRPPSQPQQPQQPQRPPSQPQQPQQPQRPPSQPQQPPSKPQQPPTQPQRPPSQPQQPPSKPQQPPTQPQQPPSKPQQPPTQPQQPPSKPQQPPSKPQQPPTQPGKPGNPSQPPTQPGKPSQPPTQPGKPSQPPTQPGKPSQPPTQPGKPGQPQQPQQPTKPSTPPATKPPVIVTPPQSGNPGTPNQGGRVLPKPSPVQNGDAISKIHKETPKALPTPAGAPIGARPVIVAPQQTTIINKTINNTTIINNITNNYNHTEIRQDGYWWHSYDGVRYCHHYDNWGYHWYGFYYGDSYYWTRYYEDRFWWYDPYWGRWNYRYHDQWWWQDPYDVRVVYIYRDNYYYRYENSGGGVVIQPKPEPTQPAQPIPNPQPQPPAEEKAFYSVDGTRSIQLVGERRDAYLYDLTVQDQASPAARPIYLGYGVKKVVFSNDQKRTADGSTREVLKQINLVFDDETSSAVVDPNGTKKIQIFGKDAYLYDLGNQQAEAKYLAGGVAEVRLQTVEKQDQNGYYRQDLRFIMLSIMDENNNETLMILDPDGNTISTAAKAESAARTWSAEAPTTSVQERMDKSPLFNALKAGSVNWQ